MKPSNGLPRCCASKARTLWTGTQTRVPLSCAGIEFGQQFMDRERSLRFITVDRPVDPEHRSWLHALDDDHRDRQRFAARAPGDRDHPCGPFSGRRDRGADRECLHDPLYLSCAHLPTRVVRARRDGVRSDMWRFSPPVDEGQGVLQRQPRDITTGRAIESFHKCTMLTVDIRLSAHCRPRRSVHRRGIIPACPTSVLGACGLRRSAATLAIGLYDHGQASSPRCNRSR